MTAARKPSGGKRAAKRPAAGTRARRGQQKDESAECAAGRHPKDRRRVFGWGSMCEACGRRVG